MRKFFDEFGGIILIVAFVVLVVGIGGYCIVDSHAVQTNSYRDSGRRAFEAGVPATANPYIGQDVYKSSHWLEGWIEGKNGPGK